MPDPRPGRSVPGPVDVLLRAAWCGLVAGWLEVGARLVPRLIAPTGHLLDRSRHFAWLVPLADLLLFSMIGVIPAIAAGIWSGRGHWLASRLLFALLPMPALIVGVPGIYAEAWLVLCLGIAAVAVPWVDRNPARTRRWILQTLPILLLAVALPLGWILGGDWLVRRAEDGRNPPSPGAPNVLLIVLDTVRADHLGLYGYTRPTSPNLDRIAARGIRFENARAAAPWTLASHATFFTGRWPHELGARWTTPIRSGFPTLAAYLGARGYATAGFVANLYYCSYDTGLARGFTHYEDYDLARSGPLRTSQFVAIAEDLIAAGARHLGEAIGPGLPRTLLARLSDRLRVDDRKDAAEINRAFLGWLSRRGPADRPFFAFLNYYDAHVPYILPVGVRYRFGRVPRTDAEFGMLERWNRIDRPRIPPSGRALAADCYDSCLGYLDDRLGELVDELARRGVLDRTLLVIVGDHGEGLGEHGLFDHGESLYRTEIHVPLVIVPPGGRGGAPGVVGATVSLRDLPPTIADLAGLVDGAPFPGRSLARFWTDRFESRDNPAAEPALSVLESTNPDDVSRGGSPAERGPMASLAEGDLVYILRDRDGSEQLFNTRDDPRELIDRAGAPDSRPILDRFRALLDRLRGRPGS